MPPHHSLAYDDGFAAGQRGASQAECFYAVPALIALWLAGYAAGWNAAGREPRMVENETVVPFRNRNRNR